MFETKEVGNRVLSENYHCGFSLKEVEFQKLHVQADELGNVVSEHPFVKSVFLISFGKQCLWLNADEVLALKALLK